MSLLISSCTNTISTDLFTLYIMFQRNVGSESQAEAETQARDEAEVDQNNEVDEENVGGQSTATEFAPGASQPTDDLHDSQGGVFEPPPARQSPSTCGVVPKAWQKKQKVVTTRAEILRARSTRERKINKRYQD